MKAQLSADQKSKSIGCFRGSTTLPDLGEITQKYDLRKKERIQCRKKEFFEGLYQTPTNTNTNTNTNANTKEFLSIVLNNEKKIERKIRSKSRLDSLFELCPMSPWRETSALWVKTENESKIMNLDFVNFYPSILINAEFPDPKDLWHSYPKNIPEEPGILRCILYPKKELDEAVREHHPFQMQIDKISCPFYLDPTQKVETIIHTNEIAIWQKYFEIQPLEAITSNKKITHPLKKRVTEALQELTSLKAKGGERLEKIAKLKLIINSATTTPKINQNKGLPSKFGVHCFSSQIVSNARAVLFETIHLCVSKTKDKIIQINTDGFVLKTENQGNTLEVLNQTGLYGQSPGKIRVKSEGDEGFFLGANTWWMKYNGKLVDEAGTGRPKENIPSYTTIPKYLEYADYKNPEETKRINLLYLGDFRHRLDHKTLERRKFRISEENIRTKDAPWKITHEEKVRSWIVTKKAMSKFCKEFKQNYNNTNQK